MSATVFYIPSHKHAELIGKGGANLKELQGKFSIKISVPNRDENSNEVIVSGKPEDVEKARDQIEKMLNIRTRQPTISFRLDINPDSYKILIGRGGQTLRDLESKYGASIAVPKRDSTEQDVVVEGVEDDLEDLVVEIKHLLKDDFPVQRPKSSPAPAKSPVPAKSPAASLAPPASPATLPSPTASPHPAHPKDPIPAPAGGINKVIFFPDTDPHAPNHHEFLSYLGSAHTTLDICVFTITDDRVANSIIKSAAKGVKVRVITDNDQSESLGSDIKKLRDAGIPVKMDDSPFHMHHKFAVIDRALLLNGSFNWTKSASENNCENIMITNNSDFVNAFAVQFEKMWKDAVHFK